MQIINIDDLDKANHLPGKLAGKWSRAHCRCRKVTKPGCWIYQAFFCPALADAGAACRRLVYDRASLNVQA